MARHGYFLERRDDTLRDFLTARDFDQMDYATGWHIGARGEPDPMGHANWAMWNGWRDGAARYGFLPKCGPFIKKTASR